MSRETWQDIVSGSTAIPRWPHAGGGRHVAHVDVSINGGASWTTAAVTHQAPPSQWGMQWAWQLWSHRVPAADLLAAAEAAGGCADIRVRAWDSSANSQPDRCAALPVS